jgi:hypothetical protein
MYCLSLEKKGQPRMVNPEKLVTLDTQDTERRQKDTKKNKNTHTICVGHQYRQTHTNKVNKTMGENLQNKAVNMKLHGNIVQFVI